MMRILSHAEKQETPEHLLERPSWQQIQPPWSMRWVLLLCLYELRVPSMSALKAGMLLCNARGCSASKEIAVIPDSVPGQNAYATG